MCFLDISGNSFHGMQNLIEAKLTKRQNMQFNQTPNRDEYAFLTRPPTLQLSHIRNDLHFLGKGNQNFRVIKSSTNDKFRVYKRRISNSGKEMGLFKWRNQSSKPLLKVLYIQLSKYSSTQENNQQAEIYTEHLTYTFSEIKNLSLAQTLYLLKKTISGFEAILLALGHVIVNPDCCGITCKGDCRVWINDNLSDNKCGLHPKLQAQGQIISQILKIIKQCSSNEATNFFVYLMKCISSIQKLKFKLVEDVINQYCIKNQVTIPLYLNYSANSSQPSLREDVSKSKTPSKNTVATKTTKSFSTYSAKQKPRMSEISSKDSTTSSFKGSQRISLVEKIPLLWKADSLQESSCGAKKKYSLASNTFLRSTHNPKSSGTQSSMIKTLPSFTEFRQQMNRQEAGLNLLKSDQGLRRTSNVPQNMMKSSVNQMASLNNILVSIAQGNDQTVENLNSDHVIEDTLKKIIIPSEKASQKPRSRNSICHQFCINLLDEPISATTPGKSAQKDQLKISFTTAPKTRYDSATATSKIEKHRYSQNNALSTSFDSQDLRDLEVSPRFSYEKIQFNALRQRSSNTHQRQFYDVKQVESATCLDQNEIFEPNKENRSMLFEKLNQEKRLNKQRRNSRLVRERFEAEEQARVKYEKEKSIISANRWKKVVSNLTNEFEAVNLQESINFEVEGEIKRGGSPIRLDMLDQLGHGMTESIIPK